MLPILLAAVTATIDCYRGDGVITYADATSATVMGDAMCIVTNQTVTCVDTEEWEPVWARTTPTTTGSTSPTTSNPTASPTTSPTSSGSGSGSGGERARRADGCPSDVALVARPGYDCYCEHCDGSAVCTQTNGTAGCDVAANVTRVWPSYNPEKLCASTGGTTTCDGDVIPVVAIDAVYGAHYAAVVHHDAACGTGTRIQITPFDISECVTSWKLREHAVAMNGTTVYVFPEAECVHIFAPDNIRTCGDQRSVGLHVCHQFREGDHNCKPDGDKCTASKQICGDAPRVVDVDNADLLYGDVFCTAAGSGTFDCYNLYSLQLIAQLGGDREYDSYWLATDGVLCGAYADGGGEPGGKKGGYNKRLFLLLLFVPLLLLIIKFRRELLSYYHELRAPPAPTSIKMQLL